WRQESLLLAIDDVRREKRCCKLLVKTFASAETDAVMRWKGFDEPNQFTIEQRYSTLERVPHRDLVSVQKQIVRETHAEIEAHHGFDGIRPIAALEHVVEIMQALSGTRIGRADEILNF